MQVRAGGLAGGPASAQCGQKAARVWQLCVRWRPGEYSVVSGHHCIMLSWQVLLVTGGYNYRYSNYLDSTELLLPGSGSWRLAAGLLPRPMDSMRVATVANTLYLTGGIVILL